MIPIYTSERVNVHTLAKKLENHCRHAHEMTSVKSANQEYTPNDIIDTHCIICDVC